MTIAVLWYRESLDELWCASDSRLSAGDRTMSDSGPKILPVPIVCHKQETAGRYVRTHTHSFGFAFSGSTLSAISTHALVTACTQNFATAKDIENPPRLESIAELFRVVAEHYIREMSGRDTGSLNPTAYFFDAFLFGYCPVAREYQGFGMAPNITGPELKMLKSTMRIQPHIFHPIGSGAKAFVELSRELDRTHKNPGVIVTLREMLKRERVQTVGGHFQIGIAHRAGFDLQPILNLAEGPLNRKLTFLGWDVDSIGEVDSYRIGYRAISPDVD